MSTCITETFQESAPGSWGWRCSVCSVGQPGLVSEDAAVVAVRRHRSARFAAAFDQALNAPDLQEELRQLRARKADREKAEEKVDPIDWPARFRAAAEVVHQAGDRWPITAQHFDDIADRLESGLLPPDVVEAIRRALMGEGKAS